MTRDERRRAVGQIADKLRALHQFDCPSDVPEIESPQLLRPHTFRAVDPLLAALDQAAGLAYVDAGFVDQVRTLVLETCSVDRALRPAHLRARRPHLRERAVGRPCRHRPARLRVVTAGPGRPRPRRVPAVRVLPLPARGRGLRGRDAGRSTTPSCPTGWPRTTPSCSASPRSSSGCGSTRSPTTSGSSSPCPRPARSASCRPITRTAASSARSGAWVTSTGWPGTPRPTRCRSTRAAAVIPGFDTPVPSAPLLAR